MTQLQFKLAFYCQRANQCTYVQQISYTPTHRWSYCLYRYDNCCFCFLLTRGFCKYLCGRQSARKTKTSL